MDWSLYTIENLRTLPVWLVSIMIAMFSSLLGSFLNVCIYRIPRGESIIFPRSRCTTCGHVLGVPDLLPVLSWVFLGGKCRHCKAPVSPRYAMIELLIVVVWVGSFLHFGLYPAFPITAILISLLIVSTGIFIYGRHIRGEAGHSEGEVNHSEAGNTGSSVGDRNGLTFLEILFTAVILAAVVGPFFNLNFTERASALRNREKILAYSLAREKLQELRCLPARKVQSDWIIYRGEGSALSHNIFRDELFGIWAQMDDSGETFLQNMTDILTVDGKCAGAAEMPAPVFEKFKNNFKEYYGFDYEPYPDAYKVFRRTTTVDDLTKSDNPGNILKRVIVTVEIKSNVHQNGYKIRLASYLGDS
jgi:hypothetical protein